MSDIVPLRSRGTWQGTPLTKLLCNMVLNPFYQVSLTSFGHVEIAQALH